MLRSPACLSQQGRRKEPGIDFVFVPFDAKESEKRALQRVSRFLMPDMKEEVLAGQGPQMECHRLSGVGHPR